MYRMYILSIVYLIIESAETPYQKFVIVVPKKTINRGRTREKRRWRYKLVDILSHLLDATIIIDLTGYRFIIGSVKF